jgi:hypothetical protein
MIFTLREREIAEGVLGHRGELQNNSLSLSPLTQYGMAARDRLKTTAPGPNTQIELRRVVEIDLSKE